MKGFKHHLNDQLAQSYVAGQLPHPFAMLVAAHAEMCPECRARIAALECTGGVLLEEQAHVAVSDGLKSSLMALLDDARPVENTVRHKGIFPSTVVEAMGGDKPHWRNMGGGAKQCFLWDGAEGSARLLLIPAGQAVPDHGHSGLELTMVLQGAYETEEAHFGVGDLEIANDEIEHTPVAVAGEDCICLTAFQGHLKFNSLLPRLARPFLRF